MNGYEVGTDHPGSGNFPINFTHQDFPADGKSSSDLGAPLGLMANPFLGRSDGLNLRSELTRNTEQSSLMARCTHCAASCGGRICRAGGRAVQGAEGTGALGRTRREAAARGREKRRRGRS